LAYIEKMGNYTPVGCGGGDGGKRAAAPTSSRLDIRAEKKRRRDDSSEEERVSNRTSRSENWKERGRGSGRMRGGDGPRGGRSFWGRGGHNHERSGGFNRYGDQDSAYHSRQRDGFYNSGYPGRGPKGSGGHRGRQNRGGHDRWGNPY
jgi:hypothetical protein